MCLVLAVVMALSAAPVFASAENVLDDVHPYITVKKIDEEPVEVVTVGDRFSLGMILPCDLDDLIGIYLVADKSDDPAYALYENGSPCFKGYVQTFTEYNWILLENYKSDEFSVGSYYLKVVTPEGAAYSDYLLTFELPTHVLYGSYPQSLVTDEYLISLLDEEDKTWTSYGYYIGTGQKGDGLMAPDDFMQYCDFEFGSEKYRAVRFDDYRPFATYLPKSQRQSDQSKNGYEAGKVYYFVFEPIRWKILDEASGLVMTESIIDLQAFQNVVYARDGYFYNGFDSNVFANDYASSYIRYWLNNDFLSTAFTPEERTDLRRDVAIDFGADNYGYDRVFLLSEDESLNTDYGFISSGNTGTYTRVAFSTDYTQCQGVCIDNNGASYWSLRSSYKNKGEEVRIIAHTGDFLSADASYNLGVRPVIRIASLATDPVTPYEEQTLTEENVTLSETSFTYNGSVQKPAVTVTDAAGTVLTEGTSYTLTWSGDCKAKGTYTVTVTAKGSYYTGTVEKTFTIK